MKVSYYAQKQQKTWHFTIDKGIILWYNWVMGTYENIIERMSFY